MDVVAELELLCGDLDQGQPGLQTVGEIVERMLIALGLLALVFQQLADGFGQRRQLPLVVLESASRVPARIRSSAAPWCAGKRDSRSW